MIQMIKFLVTRPKDKVIVYLMKNKLEDSYSYVNITKGHICPCKFSSIESAIKDMDTYIKKGKIIKYEIIE